MNIGNNNSTSLVISSTIDTLRAMTSTPITVYVTGYATANDNAFGSHFFKWNPTSIASDNGGTIIKLTGITTGRYELQYNGAVNVKWFGNSTAQYQYVLNSFDDILFEGTITVTASLCINRSLQKITCIGSFAEAAFPVFIIGQNSNGTLTSSSTLGVEIDGLTMTGTLLTGSCGIFIRNASTVKITNPHIWNIDTAIKTDGQIGGYENLGSVIINPDLRYCNYGIYDPNGALQTSKVIGGRIEANKYSGVYINSTNVSFIGVIIEGNQSVSKIGEVTFGSSARKVNFTDCYFEALLGGNVFYNNSPILSLSLVGSSFFGHDTNKYLIGNTITLTEGSIEVNNCYLDSSFVGIYNASITGNTLVSISNNFKGFSASYTAGMTFSGGGSYNVSDRTTGIETASAITAKSTANLKVGYKLGVNTISTSAPAFVGLGAGSGTTNWTNLVSISSFQGSVPTVYRVVLLGKVDSTNTRMAEFRIIVKQDLLTIEVATKITDWNMAGLTPAFQIAGGFLQANQLSSSTSWVCLVEAMSYGYSL
jgi:hypothetical protein